MLIEQDLEILKRYKNLFQDTYQKFVDKKLYVPELFNSWLEIISAWDKENDEFKGRIIFLPVCTEEFSINFILEDLKKNLFKESEKFYPSYFDALLFLRGYYYKIEFIFRVYKNYHSKNQEFYQSLIHTEDFPEDISFFLKRYATWKNSYESMGSPSFEILDILRDNVNHFLRRKILLSFGDFIYESNPKRIISLDYNLLGPKISIKLFRYRAQFYIASLSDCENAKHNLTELVNKMQVTNHKFIEKMKNEPSWIIVNKRLGLS